MQVLGTTNAIDNQHRSLLNLFQRFIDIHSDDQENLSYTRQNMNQNMKREWNYFRDQISVNPLNTDKISTYFHLLEKNQIPNNADSSPVSSPLLRPSENYKQMSSSSKSPNTRFMTINPNDVPKDAFKKNCFKRSTNASQNRINANNSNLEVVGSNNSLQAEGYFSPQVQPTSDKYFSQALNQFEKNNFRSSRSPISGQSNNQNSFTAGASIFNNQQQQQNQVQSLQSPERQIQQQQLLFQNTNQTYTPSPPIILNNPSGEPTSIQQPRGLIKVDETTFSGPSFPAEPINKLPQLQGISKFNNNDNSSSHSESSSTRNSQDIINNISNLQQNNTSSTTQVTTTNLTTIPSLNTTAINPCNTSLQIENLKNQAQQFLKEYKNQQQDSQRSNPNQQDSSRNLMYQQSSSNPNIQPSINQLQINPQMTGLQQQQVPLLPLNQFSTTETQRGLPHNQYLQPLFQSNNNQAGQSHSLDHNQNNSNRMQTIHHLNQYRALSPTPQSTSYNPSFTENRAQSPNGRLINNPQLQYQFQQQSQLPPTNPTKNILNYKNKLQQAANQAIPLNQLSIVSTPTPAQPKSESFSGGFSNPSTNSNIPSVPVMQGQILQQQTGQRYPSPLISGKSPRQQQPLSNNQSEQQAIIDEMLKYQFKTKNIIEKTQLLETFMKNNSSAINSFLNDNN